MFIGSVFIMVIFDMMNIMVHRVDDVYISTDILYSALFMGSCMCILEIFMHYNHTSHFETNTFVFFIMFALFTVFLSRKHHSVALTTSDQILKKSKNKDVKKLANQIIQTQEK